MDRTGKRWYPLDRRKSRDGEREMRIAGSASALVNEARTDMVKGG